MKKVTIKTTENYFNINLNVFSSMEETELHEYFRKCRKISELSNLFEVVAHRSKATEINRTLLDIDKVQALISDCKEEEEKTPYLAKLRYLEAVIQVLSEECQNLLQEEYAKNRKEVLPNMITGAVFIGKTKKAKKLWNKQRLETELELPNISKAKRARLEKWLNMLNARN